MSACSSPSTAASQSRLGAETALIERAPLTIDIDHHHDNSRFGDLNLIVADASSTSEIMRDLFRELGVEVTPEIAEPLYIALVTDTGRFQYSNTTPKSLRLAAELIEAGADVQRVFQGVYESVEFPKLKLLARALERAQSFDDGRLVVSYLLKADFGEVGAQEPYSEGIIDYLRSVEGAEMVALIRQPPTPRRAASPGQPPREHRPDRRLRHRTGLRRRRAPPGRGLLERAAARRSDRVPAARVCRRERLSRRGSSSSTNRPAPRPMRSSPTCAGARAPARATRGRSIPSPRG